MPALDGLRGVAVLAVILFHAGWLRGGFLGVDLFFVLSGFLITSLLLIETGRERGIELAAFWARRARRLLPALFLTLLAVAAYAATIAAPTELARIRGDSTAALLYYANWHALIAKQSYWNLFSLPSPLAHTWSLAIEEQFYLLWPLVVVAAARAKQTHRTLLTLCVAGTCASWVAMVTLHAPGVDTSRMYYGTDTRACALLLGSALAAYRGLFSDSTSPWLEPAAWAAAIILGLAWWHLDVRSVWLYHGGFAICQVATVMLLIVSARSDAGPMARLLAWRPLRYVGTISYGLYLWHWPVFIAITESRVGLDGLALNGLRIAISFVLAIASFHAIERPIRYGFTKRRSILIAVGAFVAVGGVVLVATAPRADDAPRLRRWLPPGATAQPPLTVLIAGDSVAQRLAHHVAPIQQRLAVTVVSGAEAGCGLIDPTARLRRPDGMILRPGEQCPPLASRWRSLPNADAALLVVGAASRGEYEINGGWRAACDRAFVQHYQGQTSVAIRALAERAGRVHIATVPYLTADEYGELEDRNTDCLNDALRRAVAADPRASLIDLAAHVCPSGRCRSRIDGVLLRFDGQHFEGEGAEMIGWWLIERVRASSAR